MMRESGPGGLDPDPQPYRTTQPMAREQEQFLDVLGRDAAWNRWYDVIRPAMLGSELIPLAMALGRVLAEDVCTEVDVPGFDRSNVDGFAVRSQETFGASEEGTVTLGLLAEEIPTGVVPRAEVASGTAAVIATGGMLPRGADAVLMIEHAEVTGSSVRVLRPVAPGQNVSFTGTDMALGELVLRRGTRLSARDTGVLAAIGRATVPMVRQPRVAILSTGDEILAPGEPVRPASVYDANATLIADAVRELGGLPIPLGIVPDDEARLDAAFDQALAAADLVVLSGGTSKGGGDVSYRVLARRIPGVLVHGVALKPGKPVCLGAVGSTPVAILPGFPTSAIFTFHEFVAPVLRTLGGLHPDTREAVPAELAVRCNSERGRTEYLLVNLVAGHGGWTAYPLGKGSGSVTTFSRADGFVVIARDREYLEAGDAIQVTLLGRGVQPADLIAIGSHCIGLDALLGLLAARGQRAKTFWVGSQGGLTAAARGECDLAGIHLLDPNSERYNVPFLPDGVRLLRGYDRMQGLVYRPGDARFEGRSLASALVEALGDRSCVLVGRNRGSGTRVLLDHLLSGRQPAGLAVEVRSHNAVAASVAQGRADWGLAIDPVARAYGLGFTPVRVEQYDFAVPMARWDRPAVAGFRALLREPATRQALEALGFRPPAEPA